MGTGLRVDRVVVKKLGGPVVLVVSNHRRQAVPAAFFVCNTFQAVPVLVCKEALEQGSGQPCPCGQGCANAVIGEQENPD